MSIEATESIGIVKSMDSAEPLKINEELTVNRGEALTEPAPTREEMQMQITNDLLFTDLSDYLHENKPELVNSYCLWGISDGIARISKLFDLMAPNNPELAASFAGIGVAVAKIGKEMAERHEAEEDMANIELTQEHIQSIKDRISIIDVDLPDHLKD